MPHQTSTCSVAGLLQLRWSIPIPLGALASMIALLMEVDRLGMERLFALSMQTLSCTRYDSNPLSSANKASSICVPLIPDLLRVPASASALLWFFLLSSPWSSFSCSKVEGTLHPNYWFPFSGAAAAVVVSVGRISERRVVDMLWHRNNWVYIFCGWYCRCVHKQRH